jgi:hypothetical protein
MLAALMTSGESLSGAFPIHADDPLGPLMVIEFDPILHYY